jgi:hypothetical protein
MTIRGGLAGRLPELSGVGTTAVVRMRILGRSARGGGVAIAPHPNTEVCSRSAGRS